MIFKKSYISSAKKNIYIQIDACVLLGPRGSVGFYVWHHPSHIEGMYFCKFCYLRTTHIS